MISEEEIESNTLLGNYVTGGLTVHRTIFKKFYFFKKTSYSIYEFIRHTDIGYEYKLLLNNETLPHTVMWLRGYRARQDGEPANDNQLKLAEQVEDILTYVG